MSKKEQDGMSRKERNLTTVERFEREHARAPFDLHEVYRFAKANDLWEEPKDLAEKMFIKEVAKDLREEYIDTDDGSRVRKYHAVIKGEGAQRTLWANIFTAPKQHLEEGFGQRRQQSLGDTRQLKADMDFVNKKRFKKDPIAMSFNFDEDLAEEEALKEMRKKKGAA
jgi:hypothetical protein